MFSKAPSTPQRSFLPIPLADEPLKPPRAASLNEGLGSFSSVSEYLRFNELLELASTRRADTAILCQHLQVAEVRDKVLAALIHRPVLLRSPGRRAQVLESVRPFAEETLVKEYAVRTLESDRFQNEQTLLAATGKILLDAAHSLEPRQIKRIAHVAAKLNSQEEPLSASAAQYILHKLPASPTLVSSAITLTHEWFISRKGGENPWMSILSKYPTREGCLFLRDVVQGVIPHTTGPSLTKLILSGSFHLHSSAALAGTVGVVLNNVFAVAGLMGRVSSVKAFFISAGLLYFGKMAGNIARDVLANEDRNYERVEAIAHISLMGEQVQKEGHLATARLAGETAAFLFDASNNLSQKRVIREAARIAQVTPFEPSELWTRAVND